MPTASNLGDNPFLFSTTQSSHSKPIAIAITDRNMFNID